MQIKRLSENSFYILLSNEDMREMGISFEELDYSNIETRRIIWTLLEEARNTLGRDIDPRSKMLIEVFKDNSGCKIEFTLGKNENRERYKIKKDNPLLAAYFKNLNGVYLFAEKSESDEIQAEIYTYRDGYALILFPLPDEKARFKLLLGEFSVLLPDSFLFTVSIREHGKLIFQGNLKRLSV